MSCVFGKCNETDLNIQEFGSGSPDLIASAEFEMMYLSETVGDLRVLIIGRHNSFYCGFHQSDRMCLRTGSGEKRNLQ